METPAPKKILLVDDDPVLIQAYRPRLEAAGYAVQPAVDGLDAMRQMSLNPPDVIIMDLFMPKFNGVEIMGFIRSNPKLKHVPVIVLSSNQIIDSDGEPILETASRRLLKGSCTPDSLLQAIRQALATVPPA
jgi:two-component system sensor histidine kinase and response regulator WspE